MALTVCTIPLGSFWSFALLFLYTGFALVFFLFSQLLGLQVKANSVEFAGSFPIKASQDLTVVLLKGSTAPAQHRTNSARRLLQNAQLNVPASSPAGSQGSPNVTGMPCGNGSNSATGRPGSSALRAVLGYGLGLAFSVQKTNSLTALSALATGWVFPRRWSWISKYH